MERESNVEALSGLVLTIIVIALIAEFAFPAFVAAVLAVEFLKPILYTLAAVAGVVIALLIIVAIVATVKDKRRKHREQEETKQRQLRILPRRAALDRVIKASSQAQDEYLEELIRTSKIQACGEEATTCGNGHHYKFDDLIPYYEGNRDTGKRSCPACNTGIIRFDNEKLADYTVCVKRHSFHKKKIGAILYDTRSLPECPLCKKLSLILVCSHCKIENNILASRAKTLVASETPILCQQCGSRLI